MQNSNKTETFAYLYQDCLEITLNLYQGNTVYVGIIK